MQDKRPGRTGPVTRTFTAAATRLRPAVYCHELSEYVPPDIAECSQFTGIAAMSLHERQRLALPIARRGGGPVRISRS